MSVLSAIIACGLLAIVYGVWAILSVLRADPGNEKMQEIAAAVREGAQAYLKRQYTTIGIVGIAIFLVVGFFLGWLVAIGFAIGAVLSGAAGFIGMNVSVRANLRTAQAATVSLGGGLEIAFKSGAITGMFVAGLALLGVACYYAILTGPMGLAAMADHAGPGARRVRASRARVGLLRRHPARGRSRALEPQGLRQQRPPQDPHPGGGR